jgi:hypothetical protein
MPILLLALVSCQRDLIKITNKERKGNSRHQSFSQRSVRYERWKWATYRGLKVCKNSVCCIDRTGMILVNKPFLEMFYLFETSICWREYLEPPTKCLPSGRSKMWLSLGSLRTGIKSHFDLSNLWIRSFRSDTRMLSALRNVSFLICMHLFLGDFLLTN